MIRLNLGSADLPKEGWTNIDLRPSVKPDLVADVLDLSSHFEPNSVDEIWAAHLLEHLYPEGAEHAIKHWKSLLKPGGTLGIVTPDFHYIADMYLKGAVSLKEVNDLYLYSYVQESNHRYMWDLESLMQLFERHGFNDIQPIDKLNDPRLAYGVEWQCGASAIK